ncbi:MAG: FGGY family carbohydrate kinase [Planctomycetota bacterium]
MSPLAAIDIGTTLIKAGVFNESGDLLGLGAQPFDLVAPQDGWFELAPDACWQAICAAMRQAIERSGGNADNIAAIGLSSQGQTVVPVDANGNPLSNFIVWLDRRAAFEASEIESRFHPETIYHQTGVSQLVPGHTVSVLSWQRKHRPDIFRRASRFLLTKDYATLRMTGQAAIDHQLAGSTACYSVPQGGWWDEMLEFIGVSHQQLSPLFAAEETVGELAEDAARALGIPAGCPVVAGAWDQIAGAIGAGNVRPGIVTEMTGSCLALFATCKDFMPDPQRRMLAGRHAVGGYGYLLPYTEFAGKALQLVRDTCYGTSTPYEGITAEAVRVPIGCDGLAMDLRRTATKIEDALISLSPRHTRAHIARAAMEAAAFALKDHIDALVQLHVQVGSIISLGGGARSDFWLQMKADLLGLPVNRPACTESALLGAAILAGKGCGIYDDAAEAAERIARVERVFEPRGETRDAYLAAYEFRSKQAARV